MKTAELLQQLRSSSDEELRERVLALRKQQFERRVQQGVGEFGRFHEFAQARREIARIKTVLRQRGEGAGNEGQAAKAKGAEKGAKAEGEAS